MDLSVKCKTVNLLEENKGKSVGCRVRRIVPEHDFQSMSHMMKINCTSKLKNSCSLRKTLRETKNKYRLGKILTNHTGNKGSLTTIYIVLNKTIYIYFK